MEKDQWDRYLIVPPNGGEPVAHTRATTHAATLDDRYALQKWEQRMVAIGLTRRPDLLAQIAAHEDEKKRIDSIVVDATEAAEASRGRNMGDALHRLTERYDRGDLKLAAIGEAWRPDIEAYAQAMIDYHFSVEFIERIVVIPSLTVAGTFDRTVLRDGRRYILDVKTGQSLGYGTIAIQLALYAHAETLYDPSTDTHSPMPETDLETGFVMHVAAGSGQCECVAVDLAAGWKGAQLAHTVRAWRKAKVVVPVPKTRRDWLIGEIQRLYDFPDAVNALAAQWPIGVPTLQTNGHSAEQLDMIATTLHRIEGEHRVPFGEPDPGFVTPTDENRTEQESAA